MCARKGRYHVHKLVEKYGRKGNLMKWKEQLNGDCPRRDALLGAVPTLTFQKITFVRVCPAAAA